MQQKMQRTQCLFALFFPHFLCFFENESANKSNKKDNACCFFLACFVFFLHLDFCLFFSIAAFACVGWPNLAFVFSNPFCLYICSSSIWYGINLIGWHKRSCWCGEYLNKIIQLHPNDWKIASFKSQGANPITGTTMSAVNSFKRFDLN